MTVTKFVKDGKPNNMALLSAITKIPEEELRWIANRLQQLMAEGVNRADAGRMVREECRTKPWLKDKV